MNILEVAASTIIFILVASAILFSWIFKRETNPPLPPGPRGLPVLGYLPFLEENLHHQFSNLAQKYGPIYKFWLGSKLCVVISSPSLIKEVVRDHDTVFANRDPPIAAIATHGGHDIFWPPYGQYWRDMRKLFVREMLSNNNLDASYVLRKEEVRKMVREVYSTKLGKPVEIGQLVFLTELSVIFSLIWGGKIDEKKYSDKLDNEFREMVLKFVDLLGRPNVSDFFPVLAKFDLQGIEKEARGVMSRIEETLDSIIDDRTKMMSMEGEERSDDKRKDFLETLLELKEQKVAEKPFGLIQIKAILMDVIAGGTDTTATIVEWVMAELLLNPKVMSKVQEEITSVVGTNNLVEESHFPKLNYLEAVVKETFRLHPPLPLLPRFPSQSCTIGRHTVPKGSRIFLNMWSVRIDPQIWEDPSQFKPERFMNDSGSKLDYLGNSFEFLPFGSGRRVCPGISLGERMVMYLLATLLHSFDWRLPEGEKLDMSEKFGIVTKKRTPLYVVPSQRLQNLDMYT